MIKHNNGELQIRGSLLELEADVVLILNKVRKDVFEPILGVEEAEKKINRLVEISKMSDDEVEEKTKESEKTMHDVFGDIFKDIFGKEDK